MPQMAPINWLSLMIMFTMALILFNILNNFSFSYKIKSKKTQISKNLTNWKW